MTHCVQPSRWAPPALLVALMLSGCAYMPQFTELKRATAPRPVVQAAPLAPVRERADVLLAITDANQLLRMNAGTPGEVIESRPLTGLQAGEQILAMDSRFARGEVFALSSRGRLLKIDPTGRASPVGAGVALPAGQEFGLDVNPAVDRLRVVSDQGANLRLHPDTGAQVDGDAQAAGVQADGALMYRQGDLLAGYRPRIVAAAYTYHPSDDKITTNYAIDAATGHLVIQGSLEGTTPVVSPNTGLLQSVGPLGIERFDRASFDISDIDNAAYLVVARQDAPESRLYEVNLSTGQARLIGAIASDRPVRAMAIAP